MKIIHPPSQNQIKRFFLINLIASMLCLFFLLSIPGEGGHAFIFGYSKARIILLLIILLITIITTVIYANLYFKSSMGKRTIEVLEIWSQNIFAVYWTRVITTISFGVGGFLLMTTLFTGDQYWKGLLLRLSPLIGLGTLIVAQINYACIRLSPKSTRQDLFSQQLFKISLIWIILNSLWFFITTEYLPQLLIFKTILILITAVFFYVVFSLEYHLITHPFSHWILAISILLEATLSIWISNQIRHIDISQILILLFACAGIGQFLFLFVSLFIQKKKRLLSINRFQINISTIIMFLNWCTTILVFVGILTQTSNLATFFRPAMILEEMFQLDSEKNIPAYFSTGILLLSSGLLIVIFYHKRKTQAKFPIHWLFLGLVFFYLSMDEFFSIHESFIGPVRQQIEGRGIFSYEWIIIAIPLVLILTIAYLPFLLNLPTKTRNLIILAGIIYIGGSLGGEMMSGWYASNFGEGDSHYRMLTALEETLEITGIIIFISALLFYLYDEIQSEDNLILDKVQVRKS